MLVLSQFLELQSFKNSDCFCCRFLFEQGDIRVLYTGDFRINPIDLCRIKPLHDESNVVKKITSLYLDTTFCDPKWLSFPSRDQTKEDLVTLIVDWLEDDPSHEIGIWYNCEYQYIFKASSSFIEVIICLTVPMLTHDKSISILH